MKQLEFQSMVKLLKKYDIDFVKHKVIKCEKDLEGLYSYPIVLKVFSDKLVHKSDKGGVIINIGDFDSAKIGFKKLKLLGGVVVMQEQSFGKEIILGIKRDAQFGPVIMCGVGGIFVEVLKDISLRICPIDKEEALEMLKELKSYSILKGLRGEKSINFEKLLDLMVKLSKLSLKEKITEIDLNPVMVNEQNVDVVDVRVIG